MPATALRLVGPPTYHLTPFVMSDLRFDFAAIRAEAKARYALSLNFLDQYEGEPKRRWQWAMARLSVDKAWGLARVDFHQAVWDRLPRPIQYTAAERMRLQQLQLVMDGCSVSAVGNEQFSTVATEFRTISWAAQQRAYRAVIANARGEA